MSTVVAVYSSDGCIGRCDAKCHDAKEPGCDCICGGRNHGVGRGQAIANTRVYVGDWLTTYAAEKGLDRATLDEMVGVDVVQDRLFA